MIKEALALAGAGWPVFALNGKIPFKNCDECPAGRPCSCSHPLCHAFHAATTDPDRLRAMWIAKPHANIGLRPPRGYFVLDVDPRNGGTLPVGLPDTRMVWSGREDGGMHLYFRGERPAGRLGRGLDIKDWGGYVLAPPSLHPDTGRPYRWDGPVTIAEWPRHVQGVREQRPGSGEWMGRLESVPGAWPGVLEPAGWREMAPGDWVHPTATSALSARVVDDLLYVFSTSTDFEPTDGSSRRGYNRIEAYAILNGVDIMQALREMA